MLPEKKPLTLEELEAQTALELPDRELLQPTFTISPSADQSATLGNGNILSGIQVSALNQLAQLQLLNCAGVLSTAPICGG
jgi:hypothetical protein